MIKVFLCKIIQIKNLFLMKRPTKFKPTKYFRPKNIITTIFKVILKVGPNCNFFFEGQTLQKFKKYFFVLDDIFYYIIIHFNLIQAQLFSKFYATGASIKCQYCFCSIKSYFYQNCARSHLRLCKKQILISFMTNKQI